MIWLNKNFLFAGIIVVALIAVYFVFFNNPLTFDSGLNQINFFWEKQELEPSFLTSGTKVFAIEESKLISLKEDLTDFKNSLKNQSASEDKEKLELLTETQLNLVSIALLQKESFVLIDYFSSTGFDSDVLCNSMNKAKDLQQNLVLQRSSSKSFNEKVTVFSDTYPEEAEKAKLSSLKLNVASEEKILELNEILEGLEGVC